MLGQGVGITKEEVAKMSTANSSDLFDEIDCLVIKYSEQLTTDNLVDDELFKELSLKFSKAEIMELCGSVALSAFVNRFHATFLTPVDDRTTDKVGDIAHCPIGK